MTEREEAQHQELLNIYTWLGCYEDAPRADLKTHTVTEVRVLNMIWLFRLVHDGSALEAEMRAHADTIQREAKLSLELEAAKQRIAELEASSLDFDATMRREEYESWIKSREGKERQNEFATWCAACNWVEAGIAKQKQQIINDFIARMPEGECENCGGHHA